MREIKEVVTRHVLNELENKEPFGEVLFLEGEPGRGKSAIIEEVSKEILEEVYNRQVIDISKSRYRIDIEKAWLSIKDDIRKAGNALETAEKELGPDAKDILKEEMSTLVISNAIQNFTELVKAIILEEGNMEFEEYLALKKRKEELENQIIVDPSEENIKEYLEVSQKLKLAKVKRDVPAVYYKIDLAAANLSEINGMLVRVLGTITKLPPMPFILLGTFGGVLFVDELTNITSEPKITALYSLFLNKTVGSTSLINPDPNALGVAILAAGNNYESSKIANVLPQAFRNRLARIRLAPLTTTDIQETGMYYVRKYPHYSITGRFVSVFMSLDPKDVLNVPDSNNDVDNRAFPSPRAYEMLLRAMAFYNGDVKISPRAYDYAVENGAIVPGSLLKINNDTKQIVYKLAVPRIGEFAAEKFSTKWIIEVPSPQELIENPEKFYDLADNLAAYMIAMNDYIRYMNGVFSTTKKLDDCRTIKPFITGVLTASKTHHAEIVSMWINTARMYNDLHVKMLRSVINCHRAGKISDDTYKAFRSSIRSESIRR